MEGNRGRYSDHGAYAAGPAQKRGGRREMWKCTAPGEILPPCRTHTQRFDGGDDPADTGECIKIPIEKIRKLIKS